MAIVVNDEGKEMEAIELHSNALSPIDVTPEGMLTDDIEVREKAQLPIVVNDEGKEMEEIELLSKAYSEMTVTPEGTVTEVFNPSVSRNALAPMLVRLLGRVSELMRVS